MLWLLKVYVWLKQHCCKNAYVIRAICLSAHVSVRPSVRPSSCSCRSFYTFIHTYIPTTFFSIFVLYASVPKMYYYCFFSYNSASIFRRGNVTKWYVWATMPAIALLLSFLFFIVPQNKRTNKYYTYCNMNIYYLYVD